MSKQKTVSNCPNELYETNCRGLKVEEEVKCGMLGGPIEHSFTINLKINVKIQQLFFRTIEIHSNTDVSANMLYDIFVKIDKLLQLFEGQFVPIKKIEFYNRSNIVSEELKRCGKYYKDHRLSCFNTGDAYCGNHNILLTFDKFYIIDKKLFQKWSDLLDELDIVHQMILYQTSDIKLAVDVKCASIIESFESVAELIYEKGAFFPQIFSDSKNVTLRQCLDAVISQYGCDIFADEYKDKDSFLSILVNTRVRMMHIKRNYPKNYLDGPESVLYSSKLILLYRRVLLDLVGIDYSLYRENLKKAVRTLNSLPHDEGNEKSIQSVFLSKLKLIGSEKRA